MITISVYTIAHQINISAISYAPQIQIAELKMVGPVQKSDSPLKFAYLPMSEREDKILALYAAAFKDYVPTERDKEETIFSFSYGNLALSTNHRPRRIFFKKMAMERGWTEEEWETWAATRKWWDGNGD